MVAGGFAAESGREMKDYGSKITPSVVVTCVVVASSGLIFGYDIGVSGGVTTMVPFLQKFFPSVLRKASHAQTNMFCMYDSHLLTSFTSSLYLAGLITSLVASRLTAAVGRRNVLVLGGATFLLGSAFNGAAENFAMLLIGRILLGFGVGFTNQAAPVYLSEMAPAKWRGAFNTGFQFFIGIGVVAANCICFATAKHTWGWRVSLGLAGVPALIMTVGALLVSDTPASLVERGKLSDAKTALIKVRGADADIDGELAELTRKSDESKEVSEQPFGLILERPYRPHLVMAVAIPFFQQLTGINIIAFYAPVLFHSIGFGTNSALMGAIILRVVNLVSIMVSTFVVDRFGRRVLFLQGGIQMILCQVGVGILLAVTTGVSGTGHISRGFGMLVIALMCVYSAGFGWSWGPLSWLIPSEIFPIKIRPMGQSISVAVQFGMSFVIAQTFLSMLCHFKFGTFIFYAGWICVMTIFIGLLLPETKGIHLDSMYSIWEKHWFWRRFVSSSSK